MKGAAMKGAERSLAKPIGEIARESGVKITTIRFYEQRGLMPPPERTPSGRRVYGADSVARLGFIRHARDMGFSLEDIDSLLALQETPGQDCAQADRVAQRHLAQVQAQIAALTRLEGELLRMIDACRGGVVGDCRVIETLADHSRCESDHR